MNSGFPVQGIPLERLRAGAFDWTGQIPAGAQLWSGSGLDFVEAPSVRLRVVATADGGAHLTGRVEAGMRLSCRRCLREIHWPLTLKLDLWFEPSVPVWEEEEGVYSVEADAGSVDLGRVLREEVLLAMPEYPLCREECRGLCPACGADRNETTCECMNEDTDPRWNALRRVTEKRSADAPRDGAVSERGFQDGGSQTTNIETT